VDVTIKNEKLRDLFDANPDAYIGRIWSVIFNDIMKPSQSSDVPFRQPCRLGSFNYLAW
jgi:hypothetical protein